MFGKCLFLCFLLYPQFENGCAIGEEYYDYFAFSPALAIDQQLIGDAEFAIGFNGVDGILG